MERAYLHMVLCVSLAAGEDISQVILTSTVTAAEAGLEQLSHGILQWKKRQDVFPSLLLGRPLVGTDHQIWSCLWQRPNTLSRALSTLSAVAAAEDWGTGHL